MLDEQLYGRLSAAACSASYVIFISHGKCAIPQLISTFTYVDVGLVVPDVATLTDFSESKADLKVFISRLDRNNLRTGTCKVYFIMTPVLHVPEFIPKCATVCDSSTGCVSVSSAGSCRLRSASLMNSNYLTDRWFMGHEIHPLPFPCLPCLCTTAPPSRINYEWLSCLKGAGRKRDSQR
ncbi:hypothetical protein JOB18_000392 [Solea senegalensis]|uniref:Uncharacterized protein n=1 Tax=Solea senegalensis TaxID=28829 RepID=A0AAV6QTZ0_SOLSE|nr:hypothetical protein JOB18_000392 [Solea senegalensis]